MMNRSNITTTVPVTKATTLPTHTVVTSISLTTLVLHYTTITNSYVVLPTRSTQQAPWGYRTQP